MKLPFFKNGDSNRRRSWTPGSTILPRGFSLDATVAPSSHEFYSTKRHTTSLGLVRMIYAAKYGAHDVAGNFQLGDSIIDADERSLFDYVLNDQKARQNTILDVSADDYFSLASSVMGGVVGYPSSRGVQLLSSLGNENRRTGLFKQWLSSIDRSILAGESEDTWTSTQQFVSSLSQNLFGIPQAKLQMVESVLSPLGESPLTNSFDSNTNSKSSFTYFNESFSFKEPSLEALFWSPLVELYGEGSISKPCQSVLIDLLPNFKDSSSMGGNFFKAVYCRALFSTNLAQQFLAAAHDNGLSNVQTTLALQQSALYGFMGALTTATMQPDDYTHEGLLLRPTQEAAMNYLTPLMKERLSCYVRQEMVALADYYSYAARLEGSSPKDLVPMLSEWTASRGFNYASLSPFLEQKLRNGS